MSLASIYQAFLAAPSASSLTSDAAINFIPTLVTVGGADRIKEHLIREQKFYKKTREEVLHAIESDNALCLELDTTVEFGAGGGSLLPGLDDNFLADHVVTLPMVHVVQFSNDNKIQQSRIYWDQGSLLRAVEVIGSRGKNWPIKDSAELVRVVKRSSTAAPVSVNTPVKGSFPVRSKSITNAMGDPKASLELFAPRNVDQEEEFDRPIRAPRGDAKPPPTDYSDLFAAGQENPRDRSESPSKSRNRAKTGAGKNFQDPRLFSPENEQPINASPQKPVVEEKFNHFEFGDGHDQSSPVPAPAFKSTRTKHQSQWDFADFVTPAKPGTKIRPDEQRHFGFGDSEVGSPLKQRGKAINNPRPDAETQIEFRDDGLPPPDKRRGPPRGAGAMNANADYYKNNLYDEQGVPGTPRVETNITNVKERSKDFDAHWQVTEGTPKASQENRNDSRSALQRPFSTVVDNNSRKKDFDSQFEINDDSPQLKERSASEMNRENTGITRRGAGQASWSLGGDDEPQDNDKKIYRTAGNGMGNRSGTRGWGIGDESADEEGDERPDFAAHRKSGAKAPNERSSAQPTQSDTTSKIYRTAGNGMGSRTGGRGWGIGDESADEEGDERPDFAANRKSGTRPADQSGRQPEEEKKIYRTAGNGMGSRTGARSWGFGDESAGEEDTPAPAPKKMSRAGAKSDGWQF